MPVERVEQPVAEESAPSRVVKFPAPKVEGEELFFKTHDVLLRRSNTKTFI
jgi:hypothetical protein